jgi:hypothetical protein
MPQPKQPGRSDKAKTVASGLALAAPKTAVYAGRAMIRPLRWSRQHPEIPAHMPTPQLLASVFLDHMVMAAAQMAFTNEEEYDIAAICAETVATIERLDSLGWLQDPRPFHPLPPPPADPVLERARWRLTRYERLSFESGYVSPVGAERGDERWNAPPNQTAHALVLRHDDGDHPWVVLQHGYGAGNPTDFFMMMGADHLHRDLGYNVICPIAPYHGPRRVFSRAGMGMTSIDLVRNLHAYGQAVWDTRRCISWAQTQGASTVACYGVSLGGALAALLAGVDDRVDTAIVGIPALDIASTMRRRASKEQVAEQERIGLFQETLDNIHAPVNPLHVVPHATRERLFIYAALGDRVSTPGDAYRLWQHWDRPRVLWFRGSHIMTPRAGDVKRFIDGALASSDAAARKS